MKKWNGIIGIMLLVLLVFSGCAAKSSKTASEQMADVSHSYSKYELEEKSYGLKSGTSNGIDTESSNTQIKNDIKKIIKNATIHLEVKKADEALAKISDWVQANDGYEFSRNSSTAGQYKRVNVVYKINPDKIDSLIEFVALPNIGKVTNSKTGSDDITDQYYDATARLANLQKGREQFLKIMEKAVNIDEILKVQNELNNISGEIESLQGKINMWNKMVAESTVTLTMTEEADPIRSAESVSWKFSSPKEIWNTMKNGFLLTSKTIINLVIWLVIFVISLSPVLVIGIVILILLKRFGKKRNDSNM